MRSKGTLTRSMAVVALLGLLIPAPAAGRTSTASLPAAPFLPRTFSGYGDFPRLATFAPSGNEGALGLYLVEGNSATQLLEMPEFNWAATTVGSETSPDGRYLAARFLDGQTALSYIELFDLGTGERRSIARGAGEVPPEAGEAYSTYEEVTAVAWLDDEHLLYSKATWPNPEVYHDHWEKDAPYVVEGEVWISDLQGSDQRMLGAGELYRVVGASPNGQAIYVTRLIPEMWEFREEGLAVLDVPSGEVRNLWPKEDVAGEVHDEFRPISLPDGGQRISFVTRQRAMTIVTEPPQVWLGDPQTGEAVKVWTVTEQVAREQYPIYNIPKEVLWSSESLDDLVYLAGGGVLEGIWRVDAKAGASSIVVGADRAGRASVTVLCWAPQGIVVKDRGLLWLVSETGEELGMISLSDAPIAAQGISDAKANWPVPFVHQEYDVPEWFDGGWSCGPTSMVMVLAYFGRLAKHPITVNHEQGPHSSDYGFYVAESYTQRCGCTGQSDTFNETKPAPSGPPGAGAHGQSITQNEQGQWVAFAYLMYGYALQHDVGHYFTNTTMSQNEVKRFLDAGSVVVIGTTQLIGSGHMVLAKGYYDDGGSTYFILNDPNYGERVATWDAMGVSSYVAYHGPQVFPHVERLAGSLGSTLRVANTERGAWRSSNVQVCLLNEDGSVAATQQLAIGLLELESLALSDVSGISDGWHGSAILRAYGNTPGFASAVVHNARRHATDGGAVLPTERDAYEGIVTTHDASLSGGGVGAQLVFPSVLRNYYGWYTSIYLMNAGGQPTSATIYYYDANGGSQGSVAYNLAPFKRVRWTDNTVYRGSARAVSSNGQPLAATVVQERGSGVYATWSMSQEYPASNNGGDRGFLPSLLRDYYTWTSAYVNRAVDHYVSGTAHFYPNGTSRSFYLGNGNASDEVYLSVPAPTPTVVPSGFHGSGTVEKTGGSGTVATVGQHSNTQTAMGLRAPRGGHREVTMPYLNSADETASLTIQNTSAVPITITANYYDGQSGNLELSYPRSGIQPGHSVELLVGSGVPASFRGSVWVQALEARGRVAVSVQQSQGNDNGYGYSLP